MSKQKGTTSRPSSAKSSSTSNNHTPIYDSQPELKTIQLLKSKGLKYIKDVLNVKTKKHKDYPELVLLKYDMLKSNFNNEAVRECRGLLLRLIENKNKESLNKYAHIDVIAMPYKKFFNWNERRNYVSKPTSEKNSSSSEAITSIDQVMDFKTAKVYEKIDGSLCTLYYYDNKWHVSSSGLPDANGMLAQAKMKFKDLFWEIWIKLDYKLPTDTTKCYMFELITPRHVIIVRPEQNSTLAAGSSALAAPEQLHERIVIHGVRCMKTLQELEPEPIAKEHGWELVRSYDFSSFEQVLEATKKLNPLQMEGFIVVDSKFQRLKVKSPQYVALHHLKGNGAFLNNEKNFDLNTSQILEVVRIGETEEFLSYFPQFESMFKAVKKEYSRFISTLESLFKAEEAALMQNREDPSETTLHRFVQKVSVAMHQGQEDTTGEDVKSKEKKRAKLLKDAVKAVLAKEAPSFKHYFASLEDVKALKSFFVLKKNAILSSSQKGDEEDLPKGKPSTAASTTTSTPPSSSSSRGNKNTKKNKKKK